METKLVRRYRTNDLRKKALKKAKYEDSKNVNNCLFYCLSLYFYEFPIKKYVKILNDKSLTKQLDIVNDVLYKSRKKMFIKQKTIISSIDNIIASYSGTLLLFFTVNGNFHSELVSDGIIIGTPQTHVLEIMSEVKQVSIYLLV